MHLNSLRELIKRSRNSDGLVIYSDTFSVHGRVPALMSRNLGLTHDDGYTNFVLCMCTYTG